MRSPSDMQTIQIDITNACNKACSNCTRFCGNHKKPFFMDYETFKRAVVSLKGYEGVIGVMGGEPTLHPEFERFSRFLYETYWTWEEENGNGADVSEGKRKEENRLLYPQREFIKEIHRREFETHRLRDNSDGSKNFMMRGPGLWSNMGKSYRANYELIQDLYKVQFLNDHINASYHQPGLFSRRDLGIPDKIWFQLRDRCWIQNEWSAAVTPKGAFFCEIAGALDMLFDGPGGWKIEPGWWKRAPEEFGDQLHWCEICGFALDTFMRNAEEEIDDVSPTVYEKLKKTDSPRLKAGRINLVKIKNGIIDEKSKAAGKHFSVAQPYIEHYEDRFNENNSQLFVHGYTVVDNIPSGKNFGVRFNHCIKESKEWMLYVSDPAVLKEARKAIEQLTADCIINPGTLHLGKGFAFFSKNALSLKKYGYDRIAYIQKFDEVIKNWQPEKKVCLEDVEELTKWNRKSLIPGKRYAIWGAGFSGAFIADAVLHSKGVLAFAVDKDQSKEGKLFYGAGLHPPKYLAEHEADFDFLLIAHYSKFEEILKEAIELQIPREKIILPYEV